MAEAVQETKTSLSEYRKIKTKTSTRKWLETRFPFLFDINSLFYFGLFMFVVAFAWCGYTFFFNGAAAIYGWDYSSQYVSMSYTFWDNWHELFTTGHFPMYSTNTYLGTDNIGSNSYYGLFDPFLLWTFIFPRNWMPQLFVFASMAKGVFSAFALRAYLKYMGISEKSSRVGAAAFAFCGYINFMVGFPSFMSMACTVPLILLGIEFVIKEQKPLCLVISIFLLGIISFFFLIVLCVWGVLYAMWRYFWTIKSRDVAKNFAVIGMGVASFAAGIMMSAPILLPSLRETMLSGRTASGGMAYLGVLISSIKSFDIKTFFKYMFMPVGGNTGRELQGLFGFFYPTCNYLWLPLAKGTMNGGSYTYDSWTASLFCYTPITILMFCSLIRSARKKQFQSLIVFALCSYLLLTNFAYYFFFCFSGDGYGRWYIVLVPSIIYLAAKELDEIKDTPRWELPMGSLLTLALTFMTWVLAVKLLKNKTISYIPVDGYSKNEYFIPAEVDWDGVKRTLLWLVYYQMGMVVVESLVIIFMSKKNILHQALFGFIALETAISGNLSFIYGYSSDVKWFNGGLPYVTTSTSTFKQLEKQEGGYYRMYSDSDFESNMGMALGYNNASTFHSLFNYDVADLTRYSYMTNNEYTRKDVYGQNIIGKSWSGYYNNKRFGFDTAMGYQYYAIENEQYYHYNDYRPNVPFGSEVVLKNDTWTIYKNPYASAIPLGHAVDSIYAENLVDEADVRNTSDWFHGFGSGGSATSELLRNEQVYLDGAIFEDDDITNVYNELKEKNPSADPVAVAPDRAIYSAGLSTALFKKKYIETSHSDGKYYGFFMHLSDDESYSPSAFLSDPAATDPSQIASSKLISAVNDSYDWSTPVLRSYGKVVLYPQSGYGNYFNISKNGSYFVIDFTGASYLDSELYGLCEAPRIYFVGDRYDDPDNPDLVTESDTILAYEYKSVRNWKNNHVNTSGGVFGFYPEGRVKYIVCCFKGDGNTRLGKFNLYYETRDRLEDSIAKYLTSDYNLTDVTYKTDKFTFKSSFPKGKVVTTNIGYDAGWKLVAKNVATGVTSTPNVYRANGGVVSFVASAGEYEYTLKYTTPYLKEGFVIFLGGFSMLAVYEGITLAIKHKKKTRPEEEPASL